MKKLFYFGILGLILFEIANVYFIMPLPGSQRINSIDLAYFLHTWRWVFRGIFGFMVLAGGLSAIKKRPIWGLAGFLAASVIFYLTNFEMAADTMFYQPSDLQTKNAYNLLGKPLNTSAPDLPKINAYQEYWHSWRGFHPETLL